MYRDAGDDRAARKIAMEQFNAQLRRGDVDLPRRTRLWRWLLRYTVGHGYEPWRALGWALGLWVLGFVWVAAARSGDMVPAKTSEPAVPATTAGATPPAVAVPPETRTVGPPDCGQRDSPCLEPALYAADLVFPIVNLGQRDNWRPSGPWRYRAIVPVLVIAGWTLTTLVVAGFTSLVRRE